MQTSEFKVFPVGRVDDEHVGRLIAGGHRRSDEGQRASGLLGLAVFIHKVLELAYVWIKDKVPMVRQRERKKKKERRKEGRKERKRKTSLSTYSPYFFPFW